MTNCPTYVTLEDRQNQLVKNRFCSKCTGKHKTSDCQTNNIVCNECVKTNPDDKFHLRPLCPRLVRSTNTKGVTAIGYKMSKADKSVALPLMSTSITCKGREADKAVAVSLKTGSQATLIKRSVVNRLGLHLEVGKVYTSLQGYAGQR